MMQHRLIPLKQIRPPSEPLRAMMGDDEMTLLVESIRAIGVMFPLLVRPYGKGKAVKAACEDVKELDRYLKAGNDVEVIDGHRRFLACAKAGVTLVPCTVTSADYDEAHAMMLHANIVREDVTPAEEGWQFLELSNKHQWSLERLMRVFKVSEHYINERVELVAKDDVIAQAVHTRQVNMSQAHELLREKDVTRRHTRLKLAVEHGYNARELRVMRQNLESEIASAQTGFHTHTPEFAPAQVPVEQPACVWCGQSHDQENMRTLTVHWYHQPELLAVCKQVGARNLLTPDAPPQPQPAGDGKEVTPGA